MSDIYHSHADALTDGLIADPDLFTPVDESFAAASDTEYGQWIASDDRTAVTVTDTASGGFDALDRRNRSLSDDERCDLDELDRVMSGTDQPLLSGSGRGAYVHTDDHTGDIDDADVLGAPSATDAAVPPAAHAPWWRLSWFDRSRRAHRIGAVAAAVVAAALIAAIVLLPSGDDSTTATPPSPGFVVPTVTHPAPTPSAPGGPTPGADGPVTIKRADSRCTAGSTDPMQAFDNDVNTAWMCVPAYGVPGTVLRVEFDNWYLVSGLSIVPGWNRINPDGSDEWIKHKTAAVVEYQFNDPDETRLTQQTNNLRDEVLTPVQPPVLASAMTITITEFGTPTGEVADTTTMPGQGGVIASDEPVTGELNDFAISSITVIGHRP